jgi:hypothetical protein
MVLKDDPRVMEIMGGVSVHENLVSAAYADSTWNKILSSYNAYEKFCKERSLDCVFPITEDRMGEFINWAIFLRKISPNSMTSYISNLKLIHNMRRIPTEGCDSFLCKTQIRGAKNLLFYKSERNNVKKTMTLPLLRLLGNALATNEWSDHSKIVVWATYTVAFMGSFRLGELLSKTKNSYNIFETFLWSDIKFVGKNSVQIHNKIPKNRTPNGEYISLFSFPFHGCCPIAALKRLKEISGIEGTEKIPVFMFSNGECLTRDFLNKLIVQQLTPHLHNDAKDYSCKSFRSALPSALASHPKMQNDTTIKRWGRWNSNAYERYTRLSHKAKEKLFAKFTLALISSDDE